MRVQRANRYRSRYCCRRYLEQGAREKYKDKNRKQDEQSNPEECQGTKRQLKKPLSTRARGVNYLMFAKRNRLVQEPPQPWQGPIEPP